MTTDLQAPQTPTTSRRAARTGPLAGFHLPDWPAQVWMEHLSILLALVVWAVPVTWGGSGQNAGVLAAGLVACVPALLLVLPPAIAAGRVRVTTVVLAVLLPLGALVVCLTAPTGWLGGTDIAAYAYAPLLALLVYAYCSSPNRRLGVAVAICFAGLAEFLRGWLSWRHYTAATQMTGTFHWHNQFATFLLPAALIALALILWNVPRVRVVGWVTAPACVAGTTLSTSRASLAALLTGWVLVSALALWASGNWRRALVRIAAITLLAAVVTVLFSVPPLAGHTQSPFTATQARTEGQSLGQNGGYRVMFWEESFAVFRHWPVTGAGFDSLQTAAAPLGPADWRPIPWAHNGYLQALSDGGIVLGLPLLLLTVLAVWLSLRRLWVLARWGAGRPGRSSGPGVGPGSGARPRTAERWLVAAAPLALLGLLAHSFVDFDWFYPALFAEAGILFGLVAALPLPRRATVPQPRAPMEPQRSETTSDAPAATARHGRRKDQPVVALVAVCVVVTCPAAAVDTVRQRDVTATDAAQHVSVNRVAALSAASQRLLADYKPAQSILGTSLGGTVPRSVVMTALDETAYPAEAVPQLQLLRAQVQGDVLGDPGQANATLGQLPTQLMGQRQYAWALTKSLEAAGQPDKARLVLQSALAETPPDDPAYKVLQNELSKLGRQR